MAAAGSEGALADVAGDVGRRDSVPRRRSKVTSLHAVVEPEGGEEPQEVLDGGGSVPGTPPRVGGDTAVSVRIVANERMEDPGSHRPYTVYTLQVETPMATWTVQRRYRALLKLHRALQRSLGTAAPTFPQKSKLFASNLTSSFVAQRQVELEAWLARAVRVPAALRDEVALDTLDSPRGDLRTYVQLLGLAASNSGLAKALADSSARVEALEGRLHASQAATFELRMRVGRLESALDVLFDAVERAPAADASTARQLLDLAAEPAGPPREAPAAPVAHLPPARTPDRRTRSRRSLSENAVLRLAHMWRSRQGVPLGEHAQALAEQSSAAARMPPPPPARRGSRSSALLLPARRGATSAAPAAGAGAAAAARAGTRGQEDGGGDDAGSTASELSYEEGPPGGGRRAYTYPHPALAPPTALQQLARARAPLAPTGGDDPLPNASPAVAWALGGPDARPPARSLQPALLKAAAAVAADAAAAAGAGSAASPAAAAPATGAAAALGGGAEDALSFPAFADLAASAGSALASEEHHTWVRSTASGMRVDMAPQEPPARPSQPSDPSLAALSAAFDALVAAAAPTEAALQHRRRVVDLVGCLLQRALGVEVVLVGSTATRTFLPSSDIDLTAVVGPGTPPELVMASVNQALCLLASGLSLDEAVARLRKTAAAAGDGGQQLLPAAGSVPAQALPPSAPLWMQGAAADVGACPAVVMGAPQEAAARLYAPLADVEGFADRVRALVVEGDGGSEGGDPREPLPPLRLHNVSFISADTPLVRCQAGGNTVDVTLNAAGSAAAALLVQCADEWVGQGHLFKRSLLLLKTVLTHDAPGYVRGGVRLTAAAEGTFSSWALCVMLLALFNSHPIPVRSPLAALLLFVEEYTGFDWGTHMVTLDGPVHLYLHSRARPTVQARFVTPRRLAPLQAFCSQCDSAPRALASGPDFDIRSVNVRDPLRPRRNATRNISQAGLSAIQAGLRAAQARLRQLLASLHAHRGEREALAHPAVLTALAGVVGASVAALHGRARADCAAFQPRPAPAPAALADLSTLRSFVRQAAGESPAPVLAWEGQGGLRALLGASSFVWLLLSDAIAPGPVAALLAGVLWRTGPLSVGQLGRAVQELAAGSNLLARVKEAFGGLKRFLASRREAFLVLDNHQYNPVCLLAEHKHLYPGGAPPAGSVLSSAAASAGALLSDAASVASAGTHRTHGSTLPPGSVGSAAFPHGMPAWQLQAAAAHRAAAAFANMQAQGALMQAAGGWGAPAPGWGGYPGQPHVRLPQSGPPGGSAPPGPHHR